MSGPKNSLQILLEELCAEPLDRGRWLMDRLSREDIPFKEFHCRHQRFILVQPEGAILPEQRFIKTLVAHHDRVPGTPGANDNGAALVQLFILAKELHHRHTSGKPGPGTRGDTEILFTDGEEIQGGQKITDQGIYQFLPALPHGDRRLYVVLDMTGRGDTVILGEAGEELIRREGCPAKDLHFPQREYLRRGIEDLLLRIHDGRFFHLATLFSDDLGILLRGKPEVQISLMPFEEALALKRASLPGDKETSGQEVLPPSWENNHSAGDTPETLEEKSFALMESLLFRLKAYNFAWPLPPDQTGTEEPPREDAKRPGAGEGPGRWQWAPGGYQCLLQERADLLVLSEIGGQCLTRDDDLIIYRRLRDWFIQLCRHKGSRGALIDQDLLNTAPEELRPWLRADCRGKPLQLGGSLLWQNIRSRKTPIS